MTITGRNAAKFAKTRCKRSSKLSYDTTLTGHRWQTGTELTDLASR